MADEDGMHLAEIGPAAAEIGEQHDHEHNYGGVDEEPTRDVAGHPCPDGVTFC